MDELGGDDAVNGRAAALIPGVDERRCLASRYAHRRRSGGQSGLLVRKHFSATAS